MSEKKSNSNIQMEQFARELDVDPEKIGQEAYQDAMRAQNQKYASKAKK
ncbi:hypothetical protein ACFL2V_07120 [Pseudomonadota bacterium]